MRGLWAIVLTAGCVVPAPPTTDDSDVVVDTVDSDTTVAASGVSVLILDDGAAGAQVEDAMVAAGHQVIDRVDYWRWSGSDPDPRAADVILWLQGRRYEDGLIAAADTAVQAFFRNGGGVIRTEYASYGATVPPVIAADAALPVEFVDDPLTGGDWWVVERDHEIAATIPSKWTEPGSYSEVRAKPGTTVVIETRDDIPLVTVDDSGSGVIIHVNHDMTSTAPRLSDPMIALLDSCVSFAAK